MVIPGMAKWLSLQRQCLWVLEEESEHTSKALDVPENDHRTTVIIARAPSFFVLSFFTTCVLKHYLIEPYNWFRLHASRVESLWKSCNIEEKSSAAILFVWQFSHTASYL